MKRIVVWCIGMLMIAMLAACGVRAQGENATPDTAIAEEAGSPEEPQTTPDAGVAVSDYDALIAALQDESVSRAHIIADMTISPEQPQEIEREGFVLTIDAGVTVTIGDNFTIVFFGSETAPGLVNNGSMLLSGEWNFGAMTLENNGTIELQSGALLAPGMSTIQNDGQLRIAKDAQVRLERGSGILNNGTIENNGTLEITNDGGSLNNSESGILQNNGHIVFDGDYQNHGIYQGTEQEPTAK
ncbi:MAG: hypothetical protein VB062_06125 [Christensenella sp.]|nr:hypothetical protein [Christensenella sp.]